jgi:hypothetical protein
MDKGVDRSIVDKVIVDKLMDRSRDKLIVARSL